MSGFSETDRVYAAQALGAFQLTQMKLTEMAIKIKALWGAYFKSSLAG